VTTTAVQSTFLVSSKDIHLSCKHTNESEPTAIGIVVMLAAGVAETVVAVMVVMILITIMTLASDRDALLNVGCEQHGMPWCSSYLQNGTYIKRSQ
jgi:hypothetical protein